MWYLIIILGIIGVIVYFWAAIWAFLKILLGIAGVIALIISIFRLCVSDDEDEQGKATLIGIGGLALTIFFVIVPYWDICRWVLLGIGVLVAIIAIHSYTKRVAEEKRLEQERLEKERLERLERERLERERLERKRVHSELELTFEETFLPVPEKLSEIHNIPNIEYLLGEYNKLNKMIGTLSSEEFERCKKQLFDKQLYIFYELNIYPESKVSSYLEDYFSQSNLRKDIDERNIIQGRPRELEIISNLENRLKTIRMPKVDSELNRIGNMDVSGFLGSTSVDKLTEQTQRYKLFADDLLKIVRILDSIREEVNTEVTKVRLVAYRNVYLAREVISYYLSKGKTREEMEKSLFKIDVSELKSAALDVSDLEINYDNIANGAFAGLEIANSLRNSGFRVGGKTTIAMAGLGAAVSWFEEREAAKEANRARQKEYVENINKIADAILKEHTAIKSTLELTEKITKANMNLYREYVRLRDRVFNNDTELTKNDFMFLIKLVNAFNEIRNDELKN